MSEQIDDNYVNGVYVKADGTEQVEISPQYVYMTVPSKYVCVYHKLLVLMAQYGLDMLNDCSATCKGNNKNIVIDTSRINTYILFKRLLFFITIRKNNHF